MSKGLFYSLLMLALAALFSCCKRETLAPAPAPANRAFVQIIKCPAGKSFTYSVTYITMQGDTLALDYLSQSEMDSLILTFPTDVR